MNSTNSVHRLYFKDSVAKIQIKAITISILSTFSLLSAEVEGRSYGAGVLKHEPSEASRIKILLPKDYTENEINELFKKIHNLILSDEFDKARNIADKFVMKDFTNPDKEEFINNFSKAIKITKGQRLPNGGD